MINILRGIFAYYGLVFGFSLLYTNSKNYTYFSPAYLKRNTKLNKLGIVLMVIIHYIINPFYCIFVTLIWLIMQLYDFIYKITHIKEI